MINRLGNCINKPVLVSMPPIFADGKPRACKLINVELTGLWLENEDLTRRAFPDAAESLATVFVPFTQIAYLVEPPPPQRRQGRRRTARAVAAWKIAHKPRNYEVLWP
jgi:hypothetical protein